MRMCPFGDMRHFPLSRKPALGALYEAPHTHIVRRANHKSPMGAEETRAPVSLWGQTSCCPAERGEPGAGGSEAQQPTAFSVHFLCVHPPLPFTPHGNPAISVAQLRSRGTQSKLPKPPVLPRLKEAPTASPSEALGSLEHSGV